MQCFGSLNQTLIVSTQVFPILHPRDRVSMTMFKVQRNGNRAIQFESPPHPALEVEENSLWSLIATDSIRIPVDSPLLPLARPLS